MTDPTPDRPADPVAQLRADPDQRRRLGESNDRNRAHVRAWLRDASAAAVEAVLDRLDALHAHPDRIGQVVARLAQLELFEALMDESAPPPQETDDG